ncbi:MAG: thiamine phosphate synthase [Deltaproteobacteria bacterium]|nr:thiamine phosphate synthase [Deltaproteobacteria bacterium]
MDKEEKIEVFKNSLLYPVTSEVHSRGRTDEEVVTAIAAGGAKIVQFRDKFSNKRRFYEKAKRIREITRNHNMLLIINDYVDVALAVEADGVHLGQEDLPLESAKKIAPNLIIGISTHNKDEILSAQAGGADYINIGPIFETKTREGHTQFLGVNGFIELKRYVQIPFSVMGGIKEKHLSELVSVGARVIAMVTEITEAECISEKVRGILHKIRECMQN